MLRDRWEKLRRRYHRKVVAVSAALMRRSLRVLCTDRIESDGGCIRQCGHRQAEPGPIFMPEEILPRRRETLLFRGAVSLN